MINDDMMAYAKKAGVTVAQSKNMTSISADNFYFEVSGEESVKSFAAFLNTPGLPDFINDFETARSKRFGVASVLQLLAKAKILFG